MFKIRIFISLSLLMLFYACSNNDDGLEAVPPRDRGEQALVDDDLIKDWLETHFYNYEDFENPPEGFNYDIVFDTIAGENIDKTPLITQVKTIAILEQDVEQYLYYLEARPGEGDKPSIADSISAVYTGQLFDGDVFDKRITPINFNVGYRPEDGGPIIGFSQGIIQLKEAQSIISNEDGTVSYTGLGNAAIFIPSGLGYFQQPQTNIPAYSNLIFTFSVIRTKPADHDNDGVPSLTEDRNGNGNLYDDDTDGDGRYDFVDIDDDGDGRLTRNEINEDGSLPYPDADGDGLPDYLDPDN